jgi:hypothetical protein
MFTDTKSIAGRRHAVSGRPMLIHTCHAHAAPMPRCAVNLRSRFQNGMVVPWHGRGMARAQRGRGMAGRSVGAAWARHGIYE